MKTKFLAVIAAICLSVMALASCDIGLANKNYQDKVTENKYFTFTLDSETQTYTVVAAEGVELPEVVYLPNEYEGKAVSAIGVNAFKGSAVKEITVPSNYKTVGASAFAACLNLKKVNGLEGVTAIKNNAFEGCAKLSSVSFGENLTQIGSFAFSGTSLYTVKFVKLETIGDCAFYNCEDLKTVEIPATTTAIAEDAFLGCAKASFAVAEGNTVYKVENGKIVAKA